MAMIEDGKAELPTLLTGGRKVKFKSTSLGEKYNLNPQRMMVYVRGSMPVRYQNQKPCARDA